MREWNESQPEDEQMDVDEMLAGGPAPTDVLDPAQRDALLRAQIVSAGGEILA